MTEQHTPVMEPSAAPAAPQPPQKAPEKKKKKKKVAKNVVVAIIVVALIAAAAWAIWYFVFREKPKEGLGEPIYDTAMMGSIVSNVSGYGTANAKDSATITLSQGGVVDQVFVTQGQPVVKGDPLYVITSAAAEEAMSPESNFLPAAVRRDGMCGATRRLAPFRGGRHKKTYGR